MPRKRVLRPERLRHVPAQFSWIDQRLVREGYLERCDAQGLSYYGDAAVCRLLSIPPQALERARAALIGARLIAYERPLYQVLALDPPTPPRTPGLQCVQAALTRLPAHLQRQALTPAEPRS